jgi:SAM-dependent methyltransferase
MNNNINTIYENAKIYDILIGDSLRDDELTFYKDLISEFGQPILELACGSGRVTIPLAKLGFDITGIDISSSMLELGKLKDRNFSHIFQIGDMRSFELNRKFKFIFIPTQSFQHLLSKKDVEDCFSAVKKHLTEDGVFLIQIFTPAPSILSKSVGEFTQTSKPYYIDRANNLRYFAKIETNYNWATQVLDAKYYYHTDVNTEEKEISLTMRQFFPKEIDALAEYNGFEIVAKFGDTQKTPFDKKPHYQHLLLRQRKE